MLRLKASGPEWGISRYPRILRIFRIDIDIARAIYPFIFLPDDLYGRIVSKGESDSDAWAVIVHERAHLTRMHEILPLIGPLVFGFKYMRADKEFMLAEELHAIGEEMKYRKRVGILYDIKRKARQFSSRLYQNLVSYERAEALLTELWERTPV